jgi:hypothetical protein
LIFQKIIIDKKALIITEYNKNKGQISIDQQVEKFTFGRKTARWNFNVFMYLLDIISLNFFVLFKNKNPKKIELRKN